MIPEAVPRPAHTHTLHIHEHAHTDRHAEKTSIEGPEKWLRLGHLPRLKRVGAWFSATKLRTHIPRNSSSGDLTFSSGPHRHSTHMAYMYTQMHAHTDIDSTYTRTHTQTYAQMHAHRYMHADTGRHTNYILKKQKL